MSDKQHDFGSLVCIYAQLLPRIRAEAKNLGYAVAIHGTMSRDLDLLAVPWADEATEPLELVKQVADAVGGFVIGNGTDRNGYVSNHPTLQPHGRLSWNICWGGKVFIDLSVMPKLKSSEHEAIEALRVIKTALNDGDGGSYWPARAFLDKRNIFNGDLNDLRVLDQVASFVLAKLEAK